MNDNGFINHKINNMLNLSFKLPMNTGLIVLKFETLFAY